MHHTAGMGGLTGSRLTESLRGANECGMTGYGRQLGAQLRDMETAGQSQHGKAEDAGSGDQTVDRKDVTGTDEGHMQKKRTGRLAALPGGTAVWCPVRSACTAWGLLELSIRRRSQGYPHTIE